MVLSGRRSDGWSLKSGIINYKGVPGHSRHQSPINDKCSHRWTIFLATVVPVVPCPSVTDGAKALAFCCFAYNKVLSNQHRVYQKKMFGNPGRKKSHYYCSNLVVDYRKEVFCICECWGLVILIHVIPVRNDGWACHLVNCRWYLPKA